MNLRSNLYIVGLAGTTLLLGLLFRPTIDRLSLAQIGQDIETANTCPVNESILTKLYQAIFYRPLDKEAKTHIGKPLSVVLSDIISSQEHVVYSGLLNSVKSLEEARRSTQDLKIADENKYKNLIDSALSVISVWSEALPKKASDSFVIGPEQARTAIQEAYANMKPQAQKEAQFGLFQALNKIGPPASISLPNSLVAYPSVVSPTPTPTPVVSGMPNIVGPQNLTPTTTVTPPSTASSSHSPTPTPTVTPTPIISGNCVGGDGRVPGLPTCLMPENLAGTSWNEVDNATGRVIGGAVCSAAVCGRDGEWRKMRNANNTYYPNGYPPNSTYIQTPFNSAYWGQYYTNGVWEVSGGGIVQPGSNQIIYPSTPTPAPTPLSPPSSISFEFNPNGLNIFAAIYAQFTSWFKW